MSHSHQLAIQKSAECVLLLSRLLLSAALEPAEPSAEAAFTDTAQIVQVNESAVVIAVGWLIDTVTGIVKLLLFVVSRLLTVLVHIDGHVHACEHVRLLVLLLLLLLLLRCLSELRLLRVLLLLLRVLLLWVRVILLERLEHLWLLGVLLLLLLLWDHRAHCIKCRVFVSWVRELRVLVVHVHQALHVETHWWLLLLLLCCASLKISEAIINLRRLHGCLLEVGEPIDSQ